MIVQDVHKRAGPAYKHFLGNFTSCTSKITLSVCHLVVHVQNLAKHQNPGRKIEEAMLAEVSLGIRWPQGRRRGESGNKGGRWNIGRVSVSCGGSATVLTPGGGSAAPDRPSAWSAVLHVHPSITVLRGQGGAPEEERD